MIEVAEQGKQAAISTLDELFMELAFLVGRTIMVRFPEVKKSWNDYAKPSVASVGTLQWVNFADGAKLIYLNLGKPTYDLSGKPNPPGTVDLFVEVSVLTDGIWRTIYEPTRAEPIRSELSPDEQLDGGTGAGE